MSPMKYPILFVAGISMVACSEAETKAGPAAETSIGPLSVVVTSFPLKTFAQRIGGEHVDVSFPVPADVDPAFWVPAAGTIAGFQQADLVLLNGAGYEPWGDRVTLPASRLVDTSASFADRLIPLEEGVTHSHGPEGEHAHAGTAFTTWLDPTLAVEQGRAILVAFERARPAHEEAFRAGFAELEADLMALDERLRAISAQDPDRPLIASHPVYQYLDECLDLNLVSVHWEPDEAPTAEMWAELGALRSEHPADWMIWEGAPLAETRTRLEELGVRCLVFAPAGNDDGRGDYFAVMAGNAEELERAFRQ